MRTTWHEEVSTAIRYRRGQKENLPNTLPGDWLVAVPWMAEWTRWSNVHVDGPVYKSITVTYKEYIARQITH